MNMLVFYGVLCTLYNDKMCIKIAIQYKYYKLY